ncbi:hypothetical protein C8Q77DRAFT_1157432 [Trametes polyzona]|nr:hypothetical protein C8Q77DRAFT_1157432 [Trametes polyzona]
MNAYATPAMLQAEQDAQRRLHIKLETELYGFRKAETIKAFGGDAFRAFGPTLIMDDETLRHVIACACARTLRSFDDIYRECPEWPLASTLGGALLDLIAQCYPSPPTPPPLVSTLPPTHDGRLESSEHSAADAPIAKIVRGCFVGPMDRLHCASTNFPVRRSASCAPYPRHATCCQ